MQNQHPRPQQPIEVNVPQLKASLESSRIRIGLLDGLISAKEGLRKALSENEGAESIANLAGSAVAEALNAWIIAEIAQHKAERGALQAQVEAFESILRQIESNIVVPQFGGVGRVGRS